MTPDPQATAMKPCPFCAETIREAAIVCRFCNRDLTPNASPPPMTRRWHPGVAAVLSLVIPGAGQLYKGQVGIGLLWLIFVVLGYVLFVVPGLILHIICIVTAASDHRAQTREPLAAASPAPVPPPPPDHGSLLHWVALIFAVGLSGAAFAIVMSAAPPRTAADSAQAVASVVEAMRTNPEILFRFGSPDQDVSTANDRPRPLIVTRVLEYPRAGIRAVYVPDVPNGTTPPPYDKWKLVRFIDTRTNTVISETPAVARLIAEER
jgi:hypothetical protein